MERLSVLRGPAGSLLAGRFPPQRRQLGNLGVAQVRQTREHVLQILVGPNPVQSAVGDQRIDHRVALACRTGAGRVAGATQLELAATTPAVGVCPRLAADRAEGPRTLAGRLTLCSRPEALRTRKCLPLNPSVLSFAKVGVVSTEGNQGNEASSQFPS